MLSKLFKSIASKGPFIGDYVSPMLRKGPFIGDYAMATKVRKPMGGMRWYTNAAVYEPKLWSASIKNGYSNISTFPSLNSVIESYGKEIHNMFGALTAVTTIMVIWPAAVSIMFNVIDDVPVDKGAQVTIPYNGIFGAKPMVEIPHAYVHLSKATPSDEE